MNKTKMYIPKCDGKIYKNSQEIYHRENGLVIEYLNGTKYWFKEDRFHRLDGPAIEWVDGDKSWYILEKSLKEKEFNSWVLRIQKFI